MKSQLHDEKMKEVLETNTMMEQKRKEEYFRKQEEAE